MAVLVSGTTSSITIHTPPMLLPISHSHLMSSISLFTINSHSPGFGLSKRRRRVLDSCPRAVTSRHVQGTFDPELRLVLELATDTELYELERILFGPSYFSPLLKSITKPVQVDHFMIGEDLEEREDFIGILESRFLFLAADARSTLRGWRPSYRNVLLRVREKLNINCSRNLSTEDLEAEIFLYLLQEYSSNESGTSAISKTPINQNSLELGLDKWKVQAVGALKVGATEINEIFLKGGGMLTLVNIYRLFARKLSGSMFVEAAKYQIKKEIASKGGQLAAVNLESRVALLAAKQIDMQIENVETMVGLQVKNVVTLVCKSPTTDRLGVAGAAARYVGFRSMMSLVGPMLWGTFLADVVIQMLGTDYARLLRAIYAIAQVTGEHFDGYSKSFEGCCGEFQEVLEVQ